MLSLLKGSKRVEEGCNNRNNVLSRVTLYWLSIYLLYIIEHKRQLLVLNLIIEFHLKSEFCVDVIK